MEKIRRGKLLANNETDLLKSRKNGKASSGTGIGFILSIVGHYAGNKPFELICTIGVLRCANCERAATDVCVFPP